MNTTPRFTGIIPPMVTPLLAEDRIDEAGLERLVEHLIAGGVSGIFALGTTGEAPSLSHDTRKQVVQTTCKLVNGRVPVVAGITDTSLRESAELGQFAADAGVAAVVSSAPFYFPNGSKELIEYLDALLPELPAPLMLYNMPSLTKTVFDQEVLKWAFQKENIVGLKDSSGDLTYYKRMVALGAEERPDWSFLIGPEELLAESILAGGHGGVAGGANVFPSVYVSLYQAMKDGDLARAQQLSARILEIAASIYSVGSYGSAIIKGIKCALRIKGICNDYMAGPFSAFGETEAKEIATRVRLLEAA